MHCHHLTRAFHVCLLFSFSWALRNVTVDDQDPAITYSPRESWVLTAPGIWDAGGAHMLTEDPNAFATFTFTGVAIYYWSSLWPYPVTTAISIDGGEPTLLDLTDHSVPDAVEGPPSQESRIVSSAAGLTNTEHTVRVFVGAGQHYGIMDMFIYTALESGETGSATGSTTSTSSSPGFTSATGAGSSGANGTSTGKPGPTGTTVPSHGLSKAGKLGIALAFVFLAILLIILFVLWRWHKRRQARKDAVLNSFSDKNAAGVKGTLYPDRNDREPDRGPDRAFAPALREFTNSPARAYPIAREPDRVDGANSPQGYLDGTERGGPHRMPKSSVPTVPMNLASGDGVDYRSSSSPNQYYDGAQYDP